MARRSPLSADEAEALFSKVDETGHANAKAAEAERERRRAFGTGRAIDPLSGKDPSGSNVGTVMARASFAFVALIVLAIVVVQFVSGSVRRNATAELARSADLQSITRALRDGVEWGSGFTQFPQDFTVQEASEKTGRVEVSVIDTLYASEEEVLATSQIQSTALAINCLMNPDISSVVYRVNVHVDDEGNLLSSSFFDFLEPTGEVRPFMIFTWSKTVDDEGELNITCDITGIDAKTAEKLQSRLGPLELVTSESSGESRLKTAT